MSRKRLRRRRMRAQRELAELLRGPLKKQGLTHQRLARRVGYERSAVSRALSGRRGPLPLIECIASTLGADTDQARRLWHDITDLRYQIRQARRAERPPEGSPPRHMRSHADLIAALAALLDGTGTSRRDVARRSGWSPAAVSKALRGERGLTLEMTQAIVDACEVSDHAAALWRDRWWDLGRPDLQARRQRRWRGYKARWYAERADAS